MSENKPGSSRAAWRQWSRTSRRSAFTGVSGVHEGLGIEEIRVHQAGEEHPHPEGEARLAARKGAEIEVEGARIHDVLGRTGAQGLLQLAAGVLARKALVQAPVPVLESGVVARDQIGEDMAPGTQALLGQQGAGGGMGGAAGALLDVGGLRVQAARRADVALKGGPILSEVVP